MGRKTKLLLLCSQILRTGLLRPSGPSWANFWDRALLLLFFSLNTDESSVFFMSETMENLRWVGHSAGDLSSCWCSRSEGKQRFTGQEGAASKQLGIFQCGKNMRSGLLQTSSFLKPVYFSNWLFFFFNMYPVYFLQLVCISKLMAAIFFFLFSCLSGDVLLTPTKIYSRLLLPLLRSGAVKAYAHITGGGLLENIPRVLPSDLAVDLGGSNYT